MNFAIVLRKSKCESCGNQAPGYSWPFEYGWEITSGSGLFNFSRIRQIIGQGEAFICFNCVAEAIYKSQFTKTKRMLRKVCLFFTLLGILSALVFGFQFGSKFGGPTLRYTMWFIIIGFATAILILIILCIWNALGPGAIFERLNGYMSSWAYALKRDTIIKLHKSNPFLSDYIKYFRYYPKGPENDPLDPKLLNEITDRLTKIIKNKLSKVVSCPDCNENVVLNRRERKTKQFVCPWCNKFIDLTKMIARSFVETKRIVYLQ